MRMEDEQTLRPQAPVIAGGVAEISGDIEWTEDDIVARSRALTDDIIAIWPGPDTAIQAQEYERARAEKG